MNQGLVVATGYVVLVVLLVLLAVLVWRRRPADAQGTGSRDDEGPPHAGAG